MDNWIITLIVAVVCAVVFGLLGFVLGGSHRKKTAEGLIGSAEEEATRIINRAVGEAETQKKEAILEAKDEIHKTRTETERELRDRRSEVQRQERRLIQKEESLDKKLDALEKKDETLNDRGHSPREALPDMANQRMCIMQLGKLHYMVLTCAHYGLALPKFRDLAMYVSNYQAKTIFTLDGGNSSQLIFLGRKKNNTDSAPDSDKEGERPVTDIIYFVSAWVPDQY